METPPRTWRRPFIVKEAAAAIGNTSTDVEKTPQELVDEAISAETPPRTWRRRFTYSPVGGDYRNTSTDVEKTNCLTFQFCFLEKHLHGRGEDRTQYTQPAKY